MYNVILYHPVVEIGGILHVVLRHIQLYIGKKKVLVYYFSCLDLAKLKDQAFLHIVQPSS